ncbi:MAG: ATP-binding protein [Pigmentiphaga sp.]|nr:ATP-binding protein [Pigmentiphaga sp.]
MPTTEASAPQRIPLDECEILDPTLTDYAGSPAWIGIAWRPKDRNHPYYTGLKELLETRDAQARNRAARNYADQLPSRYRAYTLDRLRRHPGNQAAVHAAANLTPGTNLYLWGPAGNGKTHLAVATGHRLAAEGHRVTFWGVVELFNRIRGSFATNAERPNLEAPEILILDDLGKIKPTDFVYETFYGALEHRWANEKTTIFTANHRPSDAARHLSTDSESAAAVLSRMASGAVIEIKGRDERLPA